MKNIEIYAHTFYFTYFLNLGLGTNHLRRRQIFQDFLPLPPYRRQFFTTIRRQIWQIFDPSPLRNADVLNGWSLRQTGP